MKDRKLRASPAAPRIFLLSPANIAGIRAARIMCDSADSALAWRLRGQGAPLGEVFSYISGLYFRGKLAYAQKFAEVPGGGSSTFVITACGGLVPPETLVTLERLKEISSIAIDPTDACYLAPLRRDSRILSKLAGATGQIVLLGSIATTKYVEPLLRIFGERLFFPAEFVGRGDMSRGGLMLRCVQSGVPLTYLPMAKAVRHGPKPAKLAPLRRRSPKLTGRKSEEDSSVNPWKAIFDGH
jgi:hypothetical protein